MRKALFFVLTFGLFLLLHGSSAHAISLFFDPPFQTVVAGDPVSVDLLISGLKNFVAPALSTFDLDVKFNQAILAFDVTDADGNGVADSVTLDPTSQLDLQQLGLNPVSARLVAPGRLNLFDLSLDPPEELNSGQKGDFPLATITFTAVASGVSRLDLSVNALGDAAGNRLVIPEPSTLLFVGSGLVGFVIFRRKRLVA